MCHILLCIIGSCYLMMVVPFPVNYHAIYHYHNTNIFFYLLSIGFLNTLFMYLYCLWLWISVSTFYILCKCFPTCEDWSLNAVNVKIFENYFQPFAKCKTIMWSRHLFYCVIKHIITCIMLIYYINNRSQWSYHFFMPNFV